MTVVHGRQNCTVPGAKTVRAGSMLMEEHVSWLLVAEKRGIVRVRHAISTPAAGNI
ncbi:MAG: hypothetical protein K6G60_07370 [Lachnospiraceae bacterium]|nr:hypothetical protein [Lachnospiraceae bacterium]